MFCCATQQQTKTIKLIFSLRRHMAFSNLLIFQPHLRTVLTAAMITPCVAYLGMGRRFFLVSFSAIVVLIPPVSEHCDVIGRAAGPKNNKMVRGTKRRMPFVFVRTRWRPFCLVFSPQTKEKGEACSFSLEQQCLPTCN